MVISLQALLRLANFPQEQVNQLMENIDYVSETDKLKLSDTAWSYISEKYHVQLALEKIHILDEVKQGKRKFNQNDFEEIKARLIYELTQKLELAQNQESVEEVKKEFEKYKTQPLPNDQSTSSPPSQKS